MSLDFLKLAVFKVCFKFLFASYFPENTFVSTHTLSRLSKHDKHEIYIHTRDNERLSTDSKRATFLFFLNKEIKRCDIRLLLEV